MEIKHGNIYLTPEEEAATKLKSPVKVEDFNASSVLSGLKKRRDAIEGFRDHLELPSGLENGAITLQERILERHSTIAGNIIEVYMQHMGVAGEPELGDIRHEGFRVGDSDVLADQVARNMAQRGTLRVVEG